MHGQIAQLVGSQDQADRQTMRNVFAPGFQTMGNWRSFLTAQLSGNVSAKLKAPANQWKVETFHALFIACWIHHPVEKGTFMLNLGGLSVIQQGVVMDAYRKYCSGRKSSHLSGSGRSASKGWAFLVGYHELLIQHETTVGRPYLMLKAEGHTTSLTSVIPHLKSWRHKKKTGAGLTASPALNTLGNNSAIVEGRAAENYAKSYEKLLKNVLNLSGRQVTVREVVPVLFQKTGFNQYPPTFAMTANNRQLGDALFKYCTVANSVGLPHRMNGQITSEMIIDLKNLANSLRSDGAVSMRRVYREIRVTPAEVDSSLTAFYSAPGV